MLSKLLPVFCGALITISISISSWTMKEVVDLRSRVAALESTHVTPQEVLSIWREISSVKENVVKNGERINALPNQGPPVWFIDHVKAMETRLDSKIEKLDEKIDKLPRK